MYINSIALRKSPIVLLFRMVLTTLVVYVVFSIYSYFLYQGSTVITGSVFLGKSLFVFLSVGIEAITMYLLVLQWSCNWYEIFDKEVILRKGLLWKRRRSYSLKNTQSIHVEQSPLGSVFNYGSLILHNPLSKEDIVLKHIPDVQKYANLLRTIVDQELNTQDSIILKPS